MPSASSPFSAFLMHVSARPKQIISDITQSADEAASSSRLSETTRNSRRFSPTSVIKL